MKLSSHYLLQQLECGLCLIYSRIRMGFRTSEDRHVKEEVIIPSLNRS